MELINTNKLYFVYHRFILIKKKDSFALKWLDVD
jgi:hypothetical protein